MSTAKWHKHRMPNTIEIIKMPNNGAINRVRIKSMFVSTNFEVACNLLRPVVVSSIGQYANTIRIMYR